MKTCQRPPVLTAAFLAAAVFAFGAMPVLADAGDEAYRLGAGDVIGVSIHAGSAVEPIDLELTVAGDGRIDVVHAGSIDVAGLTTGEVRDRILERLGDKRIFNEPHVAVNVVEHRSQGVNVTGFVEAQGRYYLRGPTRLLDILSEAEGIRTGEAGDVIQIIRPGVAEPIVVERSVLYGRDIEARREANVFVHGGDTVDVPRRAQFCIVGPVNAPGCYSFDGGATIVQALALAEGLIDDEADRRKIKIRRRGAPDQVVNLNDVELGKADPPIVRDGDEILVPVVQLYVTVTGTVKDPGKKEWWPEMKITDAVAEAGGAETDNWSGNLKKVMLRREGEHREVNVKHILRGKAEDVLLEPGDLINVPRSMF